MAIPSQFFNDFHLPQNMDFRDMDTPLCRPHCSFCCHSSTRLTTWPCIAACQRTSAATTGGTSTMLEAVMHSVKLFHVARHSVVVPRDAKQHFACLYQPVSLSDCS